MEEKQILKQAIKEKNVKFLSKWYFDFTLTPGQENIVRKIAFTEVKRLSISCMTQYGKTKSVSIAIALYIILNENKEIFFLAPQVEQSMILRDYLAELIDTCTALKEIVDISITSDDKFRVQASRAYQTFKNGCKYRVFTAHEDAERLMGFGLNEGIIVVDEACLIKDAAYTKIMRMLTSNPDKIMLVELFNPWKKDCRAFEHHLNPEYDIIKVDWKQAVEEGRTTKEFVETQRDELTPLEFQVLYDSEFPEQSRDALFNLNRINNCIDKQSFESPWLIISCDVADKGLDKTVIMTGKQHKDTRKYLIEDIQTESKSENVNIAGTINNLIKENRHLYDKITVFIDKIGVGTGVLSIVQEFVKINQLGVNVVGCHFGEKSKNPDRFLNKKAEYYFKLKDLFEAEQISIPKNKDLLSQLMAMKWKMTSASKIQIEDPDKSPDFADALVYFIWDTEEYGGGYISI